MTSSGFEDYYGILNLPPDCTENDIRVAYKRLTLIYHPDRHRELFMEQEINDVFTKIKKAYEVLMDPLTRKLFDKDREEYTKNNMQMVLKMNQNYNTINLLEERDHMRESLDFYKAAQVQSTTTLGLNLVELLDPLDFDSSLLERFLETDVKYVKFDQSTKFIVSNSDLIRISSNCTVKNGNGDALIGFLLHHNNSETLSNAVSLEVGSTQRAGYTITKSLSKYTKCQISVFVQKIGDSVGLSYQITIDNSLIPSITSSISCSGYNPPILTFNIAYVHPKVETKFISQVNKKRFLYGAQVDYMMTKNLSLGLAAKVSNFDPSLSYSLGYNFDKINLISGSVTISPNKGVVLKLRYTRQKQNYSFPVYLSDSVTTAAIVIGTMGGIAVVSSVKLLLLKTLKLWDNVKTNKNKELERTLLIMKNKEQALIMIELMRSTYESVISNEYKIQGLIIVAAYIGPHMDKPDFLYNPSVELANIKIPLQCLVKDSKMIMSKGSKLSVPGFYQPETFEPLYIMIKYLFRGKLHQIICLETEVIALPKKSHCVE